MAGLLEESTMKRLMEMAGLGSFTSEVLTEGKKSKLIKEEFTPPEKEEEKLPEESAPVEPETAAPAPMEPTEGLGNEGGADTVTVDLRGFASALADLFLKNFDGKLTMQLNGQEITPAPEGGMEEMGTEPDGDEVPDLDEGEMVEPESSVPEEKERLPESKKANVAANLVYESIIEKLTGVKLAEAKKKGKVDVSFSEKKIAAKPVKK